MISSRSQECPLSFLRGHRGYGGLPDKLGKCNFIWTKLDDIWREKKYLTPSSSQERPLSFLTGHGGDTGLPDKLGS